MSQTSERCWLIGMFTRMPPHGYPYCGCMENLFLDKVIFLIIPLCEFYQY